MVAAITYSGVNFRNGEKNESFLPFGRYHAFLPSGVRRVIFSAPGWLTASRTLTIEEDTALTVDVVMMPDPAVNCCTAFLTARSMLKGVKDGQGGAAFQWAGEAGAAEYHLLSVTDRELIEDALQAPAGSGTLQCSATAPACTDTDALDDGARLLFYQAVSACGPDGTDEGPVN
jgi:hypothetical protein